MPLNRYSDQFKPALIFGIPPLSLLVNSIYLTKSHEDYNHKDSHMSQVSPDPHSKNNKPEDGFFYELETANSEVSPTIRHVEVRNKKNYGLCFLVEPKLGARGVAIVMFKEQKDRDITEVHCNIRVLPFSTVTDLKPTKSGSRPTEVNLPNDEVVKLNITLEASNTGELLYKTQKTNVSITNLSPDDKVALIRELEFELSKLIAHITGSMLEILPISNSEYQSEFTSHYKIGLPNPETTNMKENLLGVGVIGNAMIDLTGVIAVGDINEDWQFAGYFLDAVLN